ncbi:MAG: FkbM family methyltransferase [Brumimicrobium sp.]|nr:FkbM family methyltransferase [Brumimicrobium sp.]
MSIKNKVRSLLNVFHLDLTKNLKYDRLTGKIIKEHIEAGYNCVDVGCHKGEILEMLLKHAPNGVHYAFEPLPDFFSELRQKFGRRAHIFPFALSDKSGQTEFHFVKNDPAYSGIQERSYKSEAPDIERIKVQMKTLDEVIPDDLKIDFIKIDVEGGEFNVLKGATRILNNHQPMLIFEFGMGASDYYDVDPEEFFGFLSDMNYHIFTLESFTKEEKSLSKEEFEKVYAENSDYYFVAVQKNYHS